ncbi:hypothetical protein SAMN04489759_11925 [Sulfitobacter delicatus]|uniref:DNA binding domain-containing protein, excisionase family n=2 Tax=Sulfitobacter delicatus TaxID=218672 RepID=A0A1G7Z752_9RHOB|nr:hypothetical protein SAMN04489759_11925 [Sulfitobacter delicatus]
MLSATEAADLLEITQQALDERRRAALILGVRVGEKWRYPALQFRNGRPLPRLDEVLAAHHGVNGWVILDSIMAKDTALGDRSILMLLEEEDDELLDRVIRELEDQFAP